MKNYHILWGGLTSLILSIFLYSCGNSGNKTFYREMQGKVVSDGLFLGRPAELLLYDSLIIIYDQYEDKAITLINKTTFQPIGRFVNIGKGPGEVIGPLKFSIYENRLYAYQTQTGFLNVYSLPDFKYIESIEVNNKPYTLRRMCNYYVGSGLLGEGKIQIYDTTGMFLFSGGKYPDSNDNIPSEFNFITHQGWYCTHPREDRYVFGASYSDKIEFYMMVNHTSTLLKQYGKKEVKARSSNGRIEFNDDCFLGYKGAYGGENYCYMLFIGKTMQENDSQRYWADIIHCYSWNGDLIASYKLDIPIMGIIADEPSNSIYGIAKSEDGYDIVRFEIWGLK